MSRTSCGALANKATTKSQKPSRQIKRNLNRGLHATFKFVYNLVSHEKCRLFKLPAEIRLQIFNDMMQDFEDSLEGKWRSCLHLPVFVRVLSGVNNALIRSEIREVYQKHVCRSTFEMRHWMRGCAHELEPMRGTTPLGWIKNLDLYHSIKPIFVNHRWIFPPPSYHWVRSIPDGTHASFTSTLWSFTKIETLTVTIVLEKNAPRDFPSLLEITAIIQCLEERGNFKDLLHMELRVQFKNTNISPTAPRFSQRVDRAASIFFRNRRADVQGIFGNLHQGCPSPTESYWTELKEMNREGDYIPLVICWTWDFQNIRNS